MSLFSPTAPWTTAASHIQVFKLYGEWVLDASDQDLLRVVSDLGSRHIRLAVEAGPLTATADCGASVEGFAGPATGARIARRIQQAGGTLDYVALDEPFAFGHLYDGVNACHWSEQKVIDQVIGFGRAIRKVFPGAQIGDIEPLWAGTGASDLKGWIRAYAKATGSDFPFFHFDVDFTRPDWPDVARQLEETCRARGIPFGMIYIGQGDTDQAFAASEQDRFATYEAKAGGQPDQVIFQSWVDKPDHVLPETTPGTFTWLVDRYFRDRSHLDLEVGPSQFVGSDRASGILSDSSGARIAGASVDISLTPVKSDGTLGYVFDLGTRTTDGQGSFQMTFHPPGVYVHLGKVLIEAWFPGDDRHWPAYRSGTITE
jgi:hypothetical protein